MKIKRAEWEALVNNVLKLKIDLAEVRRGTLMQSATGPVLTSVVVPEILRHLKVKSVHGRAGLIPEDTDIGIDPHENFRR